MTLLLGVAACGGDFDSSGRPDGGGVLDGGSFADAKPGCLLQVSLSPSQPVAPTKLEATATYYSGGFVNLTWKISGPQGAIEPTVLDTAGLRVSFPAAVPGPYTATGTAIVNGSACPVTGATVNVRAADSSHVDLRLRYVPLALNDAPVQHDPQVVRVYGGGDLALPGTRVLQAGETLVGNIVGPSGGVAGYLQFKQSGGPTFGGTTDTAGRYVTLVPAGTYDVLVIPYGTAVAPIRLLARPDITLDGNQEVSAGDALTGVVLTGDGDAVAGARVAVASGGLPPMVIATAADGSFTARVRSETRTITVIPPAPYARVTTTIVGGNHVEVRLPAGELLPVATTARNAAGAPAPGTRVLFVADELTPAGSIAVDGAAPEPAAASARVAAVAGGDGALALTLPRGSYAVVVEPPATSADVLAMTSLDAAAPPVALASALAVKTTLTVRHATAPIPGAQVIAVARGLRGVGTGATVIGASDGDGRVALNLARGMPYDLTIGPILDRRLARTRTTVTGGTATLTVQLSAAVALRGTLSSASGAAQVGVRVEVLCASCDDTLPLAETQTDASGAFSLLVPDPGVTP